MTTFFVMGGVVVYFWIGIGLLRKEGFYKDLFAAGDIGDIFEELGDWSTVLGALLKGCAYSALMTVLWPFVFLLIFAIVLVLSNIDFFEGRDENDDRPVDNNQ